MPLIGDTIRLKGEFKDFDGNLTDIEEPKVVIYDNKRNVIKEATPTKAGTGIYYYDLVLIELQQNVNGASPQTTASIVCVLIELQQNVNVLFCPVKLIPGGVLIELQQNVNDDVVDWLFNCNIVLIELQQNVNYTQV